MLQGLSNGDACNHQRGVSGDRAEISSLPQHLRAKQDQICESGGHSDGVELNQERGVVQEQHDHQTAVLDPQEELIHRELVQPSSTAQQAAETEFRDRCSPDCECMGGNVPIAQDVNGTPCSSTHQGLGIQTVGGTVPHERSGSCGSELATSERSVCDRLPSEAASERATVEIDAVCEQLRAAAESGTSQQVEGVIE